jgi:hypothetical protein
MGDEHRATVTYAGAASEGRALLETDELIFRGEFRLVVPFAQIERVEARDGSLVVRFGGDEATFELGPKAERWADRIRNPKTRADKLGVKPGLRVSLAGEHDRDFVEELRAREVELSDEPVPDSDLVFLRADDVASLLRIADVADSIRPDGHVWVVAPKGRKDIRETDVLAAGRDAGLKDTKVARFSHTHTAHRFTIPLDARR